MQGDYDHLRPTAAIALKSIKGNINSKEAERIIQEDKEKRDKEFTFKPKLNPYTESDEAKHEDRIEKLAEPISKKMTRLGKIKEKEKEEEMAKLCPFKPTLISKKGKDDFINAEDVEDRLFRDAKKRSDTVERTKKELEHKELKECTFKPEIISTTKASSIKPIYERFQEVQKKRNEKLEKLREEADSQNPELKFHPTINNNKKVPTGPSVVERLCRDAEDRTKKVYQKSEILSQQEYTFEPNINHNLVLEEDFFNRQNALKERRQAHIAKGLDDPKCTFQPELNPMSELLINGDPKRINEKIDEKVNRLYKPDRMREEAIKREIEQENRDKFTYHPNINKKSRQIASYKQSSEGYSIKKKEEEKRIYEAKNRECTFHPQIDSNPEIQSHYSDPKNILKTIKEMEQEKEEKLKHLKMEEDFNKNKECTFKPRIEKQHQLKESTIIAGIIYINIGLDRHLELQERKKKLQEERRERESQIFDFSKKYDKRLTTGKPHYTVPKPFELSKIGRAHV